MIESSFYIHTPDVIPSHGEGVSRALHVSQGLSHAAFANLTLTALSFGLPHLAPLFSAIKAAIALGTNNHFGLAMSLLSLEHMTFGHDALSTTHVSYQSDSGLRGPLHDDIPSLRGPIHDDPAPPPSDHYPRQHYPERQASQDSGDGQYRPHPRPERPPSDYPREPRTAQDSGDGKWRPRQVAGRDR